MPTVTVTSPARSFSSMRSVPLPPLIFSNWSNVTTGPLGAWKVPPARPLSLKTSAESEPSSVSVPLPPWTVIAPVSARSTDTYLNVSSPRSASIVSVWTSPELTSMRGMRDVDVMSVAPSVGVPASEIAIVSLVGEPAYVGFWLRVPRTTLSIPPNNSTSRLGETRTTWPCPGTESLVQLRFASATTSVSLPSPPWSPLSRCAAELTVNVSSPFPPPTLVILVKAMPLSVPSPSPVIVQVFVASAPKMSPLPPPSMPPVSEPLPLKRNPSACEPPTSF